MITRRVATALTAAVLLTAACGGGDQGDGAASGSAGVAESPATAEDASPSGDSAAETSPGEERETKEADGAEVDPKAFGRSIIEAQFDAGTVHMKGSFGQGMQMTGVVSYQGDKPAMDMRLSGAQVGGNGVRMVLVDGVMYVQVPGTAMGDKFLKIDSEDMGDNAMAKSLSSMNPSKSFKAFKAITDVRRVAEDTVAGVPTVHYEATVDTAKSLQAQGIDPSQAGPLPPEVTYDVWVGEDDLVRKLVLGADAGGLELLMTRWGEPVQISAPPPRKVQEMPQR